jgi:hypothetical protein
MLMSMMYVMAVISGVDRRRAICASCQDICVLVNGAVFVALAFLVPIGETGSLTSPLEGAPGLGVCRGLAEINKVS